VTYAIKRFEDFSIGDKATFQKTITDADLLTFMDVIGDHYPLHAEEAYAAKTRFGRRVVNGAMLVGIISTANGMLLGLPGGMMVAQNIRYLHPVFPGDSITATSEVVGIAPEERRLKFRTTCRNQDGELVADGTALGQKDEEPAA
jgi:3-hydroxybutyryl-CoA dehydratase